ncbi:TPA: transposase, partial [Streptococcus pneumoniae]|nr:transposase [Streptococcus pneumoniae]
EKIVNALQLPYSNAKLEATNNLIKLIKRNAFGFRNFEPKFQVEVSHPKEIHLATCSPSIF